MQIAFVAGATGYTGREVVRLLTAHRVRTIAHVRADSPRLQEWRQLFGSYGAVIDSTPWDEPAMTNALSALQPTHVFSLLGTTRARRKEAAARGAVETYETVDFGLTAILIRAAVASGSSPRFVYLSSMGVGEGASNAYLAARWRVESLLRESGLPFTIVRPSFITGPDRDEARPLERAGAAIANTVAGFARAVGARQLGGRLRSVTGAELADALVRHAFDRASENSLIRAEELHL